MIRCSVFIRTGIGTIKFQCLGEPVGEWAIEGSPWHGSGKMNLLVRLCRAHSPSGNKVIADSEIKREKMWDKARKHAFKKDHAVTIEEMRWQCVDCDAEGEIRIRR